MRLGEAMAEAANCRLIASAPGPSQASASRLTRLQVVEHRVAA